MPTPIAVTFLICFSVFATVIPAYGDVTLPSLISDHMVLQKTDKSVLWGKANSGEKITASIGEATGSTVTGSDGNWRIELNLSASQPGPFSLAIAGNNKIVIKDVLVGEVWIASGQSNMAFHLAQSSDAVSEISDSTNPQFRWFTVANNASPIPTIDCKGSWQVAGPTTSGNITAVGYYFGKCLQQSLHVPIGLIQTAWPNTPSESWTSIDALDTDPDLKAGSERVLKESANYDTLKAAYAIAYRDWVTKFDRLDKPLDYTGFASPAVSTLDWKPVTLPGTFTDAGLPDTGAIWIRRVVTLHGNDVSATLSLDLLNPIGFESVYYNGRKIAAITAENYPGQGAPHRFSLSQSVEGDNTIAIRLYNPIGGAGIGGDPKHFLAGSISLEGQWLTKIESSLPPLDDEAKQSYPNPPKVGPSPQSRPSTLFNGMICPLLPISMQGVIWYQGEANTVRAHQYQTAFPLLINDWRHRWGWDFPFYFCQLASYQAKQLQPSDSKWAELREAQTKTLSLPNTGEAILIDLGETGDIHPRNKKDVGERLASIALAKTYGKPIICSGPTYLSQQIEGNRIRITFADMNGGLVAKPLQDSYVVSSQRNQTQPMPHPSPDSELQGFSICGDDHKWFWANATIDGATVIVSSPSVTNPVSVRYAWADSPTANLFNGADLPARPFRTDDFPDVTEATKF